MLWNLVLSRLILKLRYKGIFGLFFFYFKKINKQKKKFKNSNGFEFCRFVYKMKVKYEDILIG